ncbi:MAG: thioredoxin [Tannerella sp.]|nr:thioredoxin [Tannerella sp.]
MKIQNYILLLVITLFSTHCSAQQKEGKAGAETDAKAQTAGGDTIVIINKAGFISKVWDYETNAEEWKYLGDKPCIIDFYADWCGPCRMVDPILKELAKEYSGKVVFYKINTDKERELAMAFGISSIPTYFFIPVDDKPQFSRGAMPKESFEKVIKEFLLK